MGSQTKAAMTVYPAVGVGFAPSGLFVDAAQIFGNNPLLLLFLMPLRTLGAIHHFIGTDHPLIDQIQEIFERQTFFVINSFQLKVCGDYLFIHNKNKCLGFFEFILNGARGVKKNSPLLK